MAYDQHRKEQHTVIWNSAFRSNDAGTGNANCQVAFPNHHFLSNTVHCAIKSVTLANMFDNIYGQFRSLFIDDGAITEINFPKQTIKTSGDLDTLLQAAIQAVVGGTVSVVTDLDGYMTITSTVPFRVLTPAQVKDFNGQIVSMNSLIGHSSTSVQVLTPYTFENTINLSGVRKVRVASQTLAGGRSVHHQHLGSVITSLSLHDVDYGFSKTFEYESSDNVFTNFRESRDCAHIDFSLYDEYEQAITLPENFHVDIEMNVTSVTS